MGIRPSEKDAVEEEAYNRAQKWFEETHNGFSDPKNYVDSKYDCDHEEATVFSPNPDSHQYCRACTNCGHMVSDSWVSHDSLTKNQMQSARTDRRRLQDGYIDKRKHDFQQAKHDFHKALSYFRRRVLRKETDIPPQDAPAKKWGEVAEKRKSDDGMWDKLYKAYLDSQAWHERRKKVFEIKGEECRLQFDGCDGDARHVHHKSYENLGREPLWDLEPVCENCHDKFHEVD